MPSVLMTSTMKSEPGTPLMRELSPASFGVAVSAAATCIEGGGALGASTSVVDWAPARGATAVAAPAATTLVRNLRRSVMVGSPQPENLPLKAGRDRAPWHPERFLPTPRCRGRRGD